MKQSIKSIILGVFFGTLFCPGHPAQRAGSVRMLISHSARGVFGDWRGIGTGPGRVFACHLARRLLGNRWAQRALINVMTFALLGRESIC